MHETKVNALQAPPLNPSPGSGPTPERRYVAAGLGPMPDNAPATDLYIDMVKRAVLNLIYEDPAVWYFDERNQRVLANDFDLMRRLDGTDLPTEAHTMVGLRRLENLQHSIETVLREAVPGDLVEAGVLRGGAAIFMRAVLKAHGVRDRRVVACDTFVKRKELPSGLRGRLGMRTLKLLASVPGRRWRRRLFFAVQEKLGINAASHA